MTSGAGGMKTEGNLIAREGEYIACPRCRRPLARFYEDAWWGEPLPITLDPGAVVRRSALGGMILCPCGGQPQRCPSGQAAKTAEEVVGPQLFMHTAGVYFWRALGGE